MKQVVAFIFLLLAFACNQHQSATPAPTKDSSQAAADTTDTTALVNPAAAQRDSLLFNVSDTVLKLLQTRKFTGLAPFIDSGGTILFSPYANIDTAHAIQLSLKDLLALQRKQKKLRWGTAHGSGAPILLDLDHYFREFVADADFLNTGKKTINESSAQGNTSNNQVTVFPDANFVEYYRPGDPKFDGMNWKALRLVFKRSGDKFLLVGVVHDQWTI